MEEKFFFMYQLHTEQCMTFPIHERKWYIERFIEQKEKENQAIESAKRKGGKH